MKEGGVSIVTGASSGLGRDVASLLCKKGLIVYVVARSKDKLLALQKECAGDSGKIKVVVGDLTDSKFRVGIVSLVLKKEGRIDYLINNAGFGRAIKFEKMKEDEIRQMIELNLVAYEHLVNLVLPSMKKVNSGKIINVGSVVAFTPLPYFTVYNSTKAGVYSFNRSLRYELKGLNISSKVVLPARMKTGFADKAYDCYIKNGKKMCVEKFNSGAGSSMKVAKVIVRKLDSNTEVVTPTFKAKIWYFMRYFGWIVDFFMKNVLGPKELKHLEMAKISNDYGGNKK
jgi:hypothetical protein